MVGWRVGQSVESRCRCVLRKDAHLKDIRTTRKKEMSIITCFCSGRSGYCHSS